MEGIRAEEGRRVLGVASRYGLVHDGDGTESEVLHGGSGEKGW